MTGLVDTFITPRATAKGLSAFVSTLCQLQPFPVQSVCAICHDSFVDNARAAVQVRNTPVRLHFAAVVM
jgi:hypothetical protein